jgi:hypothetical protein
MESEAVDGLLNLRKTALELEVAESMIDLSSIKEDPAELTPEEKNEMITAAYALVDLKKISTAALQTQIASIDPAIINTNVDFLVKQGILPPVDLPTGGEKRKLDEQPSSPEQRNVRRVRTPSSKVKENKEQEQEEQTLEEERLAQLAALQESRLKQLPDNWNEFPQILKDLPICEHNSASIVMDTLFPKDVTDVWRSKKKSCRQIYELSDIDAQCNHVVKKKAPEDDVCYICGFAFDESTEGLQRTCEHILPIVQAVFFLELYTTGKPINKAQLLEYDWAHRCCNYVKNDYSFLKTVMRNNYPAYVANSNQISVTLSLIQNIKKDPETGKQKFIGLEHIQPKIDTNPEWKKTRSNYILDTKIKPIVEYIAEKGDNGIALMIGYKNCLADKNIHNSFLALLVESASKQKKGGKTFKRKHNGKLSSSGKGRSKKSGNRKTSRNHRAK